LSKEFSFITLARRIALFRESDGWTIRETIQNLTCCIQKIERPLDDLSKEMKSRLEQSNQVAQGKEEKTVINKLRVQCEATETTCRSLGTEMSRKNSIVTLDVGN
jgi:hypothetical protein